MAILLACLALSASAFGQQRDSAGATTSLDEADLQLLQLRDTLDLSRAVPNLTASRSSGPGNSNAYFLRGLGNAETMATFDPAVGTYIDGLFVSRQSSNRYELFDVERVDVLRGPQGTLFGRNTTAGAIVIGTRKPSADAGAAVDVGFGSYGRSEVRASIDHPIDERWLTRLSGYYEQSDGFVQSTVTGEEFNERENYGVRGALRFLASPAVSWDLWIENFYRDEMNPVRRCNPAPGNPAPDGDCRYGVDADASSTSFSSHSGSGSELAQALRGEGLNSYTHAVRVLSTVDWRVGDVDLEFITGRIDESWDYTLDFDPTGVAGGQSGFAVTQLQDTTQWSQEVRATGAMLAGRLRYVGGLFWLDEDDQTVFQDISVNDLPANGPVGATWLQIDRSLLNWTDSLAAYAQVDFSATDRLVLTAGLRYTDEDKSIEFRSRDDHRPNEVVIYDISTAELIDGGVPVKLHAGEFTPRLAASYALDADWSLHASATRGFKSGGWNGRGSASAPCFHTAPCYQAFDPETLWTYETGVRAELPEHKLRLDATLFQTDVDDMQVVTGISGSGGVTFLTRNAADARFRGVEVEMGWQPLDGLDLHANLGLLDGEYTSLNEPSLLTTSTEPVQAPHTTGTVGALYRFQRGSLDGRFYVGGDASFADGHWTASLNSPAAARASSQWLYQAQAGYDSDNDHWTANLSCSNCGDAQVVTTWFLGPYVNEPRRVDLRAGYRF